MSAGTVAISALCKVPGTCGWLQASTTLTPATLQSIAIAPTGPTIAVSGAAPSTATGSYPDHTTQVLTALVTWRYQ